MKKVFIITALIIGIFLALQVRSFKNVERIVQRSKPIDILGQFRTFQIANEELRFQLTEGEKTLEEIHSKISSEALEEEIKNLRLLSGEYPVSGEGIELTLNSTVPEFWMTDLIAQLVTIGAEAIAINNIRLTPRTGGLRTVGRGLLMRRYFFKPPLRMSVIGPSKDLHQILSQRGGIIDRMEESNQGLSVLLQPMGTVLIPQIQSQF